MKVDFDKEFPITSVTRADLDERGFDVSEVSDDTMERLASRMASDYCEQLFWTSMEINAECLDIPKKIVLDREGNEIHVGDKVIWYDPEESARDLDKVYSVEYICSDVVEIYDGYWQAEVLPSELKVVEICTK